MTMKLLEPKEFWKFIDGAVADVEEWVLYNRKGIEYQCCGQASDILYKLLVDWGIDKRCGNEDIDEVIRIAAVNVRGIAHFVVTILGDWIFDPTHMQFNPRPTSEEYSDGWMYDDYSDDCDAIFEDKDTDILCRAIRPDIYYK